MPFPYLTLNLVPSRKTRVGVVSSGRNSYEWLFVCDPLRKRLRAKFAKPQGSANYPIVILVQNGNERMYELFVINYRYAIRIEKNNNTQRYKYTCKQNIISKNLTICSINLLIFPPHIIWNEEKHARASRRVGDIANWRRHVLSGSSHAMRSVPKSRLNCVKLNSVLNG